MDDQRSDESRFVSAPKARLHVTEMPANDAPFRPIDDVEFGEDVTVWSFSNLYGCRIGSHTRIGSFVEVQRGASIGAACKISSHSFICDGVEIEDEVIVGHGVLFVNDRFPRATTDESIPKTDDDWTLLWTVVERGASLGPGVIVLGGVRIGARALMGAGAVVTWDVSPRFHRGRRPRSGEVAGIVPFVDLVAQYESIAEEIDGAFHEVTASAPAHPRRARRALRTGVRAFRLRWVCLWSGQRPRCSAPRFVGARDNPIPIHLQEAYNDLGLGPGAFPHAERLAQESLSLPMYPELTEEQIRSVTDAIREFFVSGRRH